MNYEFQKILAPLVGLVVVAAIAVFLADKLGKVSMKVVATAPCKETYYRVVSIEGKRWNCDDVAGRSLFDLRGCTDPDSLLIEEKLQKKKTFLSVGGVHIEASERDCLQKKPN